MLIVTAALLTKAMVKQEVKSVGGYWNERATLNQGVIEKGAATIYISGDVELDANAYEPEERAAIETMIGATPRSIVEIHIGHAPGSFELAERFAQHVIGRWGGYLDRNVEPVQPID